jgi:hypothetical protein
VLWPLAILATSDAATCEPVSRRRRTPAATAAIDTTICARSGGERAASRQHHQTWGNKDHPNQQKGVRGVPGRVREQESHVFLHAKSRRIVPWVHRSPMKRTVRQVSSPQLTAWLIRRVFRTSWFCIDTSCSVSRFSDRMDADASPFLEDFECPLIRPGRDRVAGSRSRPMSVTEASRRTHSFAPAPPRCR